MEEGHWCLRLEIGEGGQFLRLDGHSIGLGVVQWKCGKWILLEDFEFGAEEVLCEGQSEVKEIDSWVAFEDDLVGDVAVPGDEFKNFCEESSREYVTGELALILLREGGVLLATFNVFTECGGGVRPSIVEVRLMEPIGSRNQDLGGILLFWEVERERPIDQQFRLIETNLGIVLDDTVAVDAGSNG